MKFKLTVLLATFVVTMGLVLGNSAAQAYSVDFDPEDPNKAVGITDLIIDGTSYNVEFTTFSDPVDVYGDYTGKYTFTTETAASDAVDAVNGALTAEENVFGVGKAEDGSPLYNIGYKGDLFPVPIVGDVKSLYVIGGLGDEGVWGNLGIDVYVYHEDPKIFVTFTLAGPAPDPVTIGGTVTGLVVSGLVLQNNGSDDETIDADGEFTFDTPLTPGTSYNVTVFTQPEGQICSVQDGIGTVPTEAVTNVVVSCGDEPEPVSIGGSVYGLDAGDVLLLANNDTDYLLRLDNGPYVFKNGLIPGDSYDVSVPFIFPAQTCIVVNRSDEVPPQNVTNVLVACGPAVEVTIGGTVDGLESDSGLVLQNNGADDKPIAADGPFDFDTPLLAGSTYSVTVLTNPTNPAQDCFVSGSSGPVPFQDVTNVAVTCAPPDAGPPPPDENTVCEREECLEDPDKQAQCNEMLEECLAAVDDRHDVEECVGAALLTCGLF
jgi:hypothetical protein